jgi:hypothetical protein
VRDELGIKESIPDGLSQVAEQKAPQPAAAASADKVF